MRNHRIHERIDCQNEFTCRSYFNLSGEQIFFEMPVLLEVLNLSVGGVLVRSAQRLELDMVLQYTFYLEMIPYIIMSRIKWYEQVAGGYIYGLEFLTIPNMMHRHLHEYTHRSKQGDHL